MVRFICGVVGDVALVEIEEVGSPLVQRAANIAAILAVGIVRLVAGEGIAGV
jgi:hypothetical protein